MSTVPCAKCNRAPQRVGKLCRRCDAEKQCKANRRLLTEALLPEGRHVNWVYELRKRGMCGCGRVKEHGTELCGVCLRAFGAWVGVAS